MGQVEYQAEGQVQFFSSLVLPQASAFFRQFDEKIVFSKWLRGFLLIYIYVHIFRIHTVNKMFDRLGEVREDIKITFFVEMQKIVNF